MSSRRSGFRLAARIGPDGDEPLSTDSDRQVTEGGPPLRDTCFPFDVRFVADEDLSA